MKLITRPLTGIVHPILTLPRLVRLVFFVITGFTAITISSRSLGQIAPQPSNPFLEFADFFPGQPVTALQNSPFSCRDVYPYLAKSERHCYFYPSAGTFSSIDLINDNEIITQATFTLRDISVRVGDFRGWWDTKPIWAFHDVGFLLLPDFVIIAKTTSSSEHSFPFRYVWSVTFIEANAVG